MRVLVACEFSGVVRDAFIVAGHNAVSCDLLPSDAPGPHIQGDVLEVMQGRWDLTITHPPCTHLCSSGARWFKDKKEEQEQAVAFFMRFATTYIPKVCIENPIGIMSTRWRKPDQIIQPWMFGHEETKATCLWLQNLPCLKPTEVMEVRSRNLTPSGQNRLGPSPDRWKLRSKTYEGIAKAMAEQWGDLK